MKFAVRFGLAGILLICFAAFSGMAAAKDASSLIELRSDWRMAQVSETSIDGALVSATAFDVSKWSVIRDMPSTVLQTLEDNGVYKNLYYGMNLTAIPPRDLWKHDWWYRTTFTAPKGREAYSIIFKGINYRADIWLNGQKIADRSQVVGMYNSFEFDVSQYIKPGGSNILAVKVTPEQRLQDVNGVELADSWLDWINWKYIGYRDPEKHQAISFVPDRNAGIWKRVFLSSTGKVSIRNAYVSSDLPLPATSPAALTVYCDLKNSAADAVSGTLHGEISRSGKKSINFEQAVTLSGKETKEIAFTPGDSPGLSVKDPDLWWPYQWGQPDLYTLQLSFQTSSGVSDFSNSEFGIRKITQHRDSDNSFPALGKDGSFYIQVNGKDFLIRGAAYAPDLLFKHDLHRESAIMAYVKDLGLNLLRWESKISDDSMLELADHEGVLTMFGWMCCDQWEHWKQWDQEDHRVARESLTAQIHELRSHASVAIWANGSDGLPPDAVLDDYNRILRELHWQNAIVDTVSHVNSAWSGIHMAGPYSWRAPYYWFNEKFGPARGSSAEEGDNEIIPPLESLKKFIPADKLWPINDFWYYHAGANEGNSTLVNIKRAIDARYGPSSSAAEFSKKAQLAHYESVRAQFETYAASGWANHKMTVYWMLDSHWPSFFGHLFDYYLKQGGSYFGAKKALRPLSVVYDYYASGDRSTANIYVVNQTPEARSHLRVSVAVYNLDGSRKSSFEDVKDFSITASTSSRAMTLPRIADLSSTFFVRCQLRDATDALLADNLYWQSTTDDDLGGVKNDEQFTVTQTKWADLTALNSMPPAEVSVEGKVVSLAGGATAKLTIRNNSKTVAFFMRAEVTKGPDGEEVLPVLYNDNYVTLFPNESAIIQASYKVSDLSGQQPGFRVEGYNVKKNVNSFVPLKP
ncbi:MAG: glycoside hydrolase [Acidipila sp.]|nr:glycoside hydrolase [Acidipila sp.]